MVKRSLFCVAFLLISLSTGSVLATALHQQQQPAADNPRVDLNTATAAELVELPGIGQKTADRIIQFREENGPFQQIEDLMNVKGIGEKKFLRLRDLITVSDGN